VLVYLVFLIVFGSHYFGSNIPVADLFESFVLALLYLSALLGTVFLFSSLFKTSLYAVLVVAVMFLFGFSIINALIEGLVGIEPWFIVTYAANIISYPLTGVPEHLGRLTALMDNPTYIEGIEIMLGYFVLTTGGGLALFEREEFS
jgi:ABC-type transport system involved in multi-copper enzyme maturation permease subunit